MLYSIKGMAAAAGYSVKFFLDEIDRSHYCGLCRQVLRGPVTTKCRHIYCFICLRNWLARYGLCPLGCNALDLSELRLATEIEEEISCLYIKCSNYKTGCNKIMKLSELNQHLLDCKHATNASKYVKVGWTGNSELQTHAVTLTINIYRTGESMGFHIIGGRKASDDITIGRVLTGYPAHKAGLLDNDKILKVNGVDVATLMHKELVQLIQNCKANPLPITVERSCHHYEEIEPFYPDSNNTLPPVDNRVVRSTVTMARTPSLPIKKQIIPTVRPRNILGLNNGLKKPLDKEVSGSFSHFRQSSSPANVCGPFQVSNCNDPDSGLSSGDKSPFPENQTPNAVQWNAQYRTLLRTQKKTKPQLQQRQRCLASPVKAKAKNGHKNIKNMGEYELEEITLHKNVSSRLGVTLGYDEKSDDSNIYVIEILPDGIAAQDARLQVGDIITKVNGFEVYDTEEVILYFLEQDPEIVLSVARPLQKKSLQEASPLRSLRRYDSCDARTIYQITKDASNETQV